MMHLSLPSSLSPFEAVSRNLESIGAISLDAFLSNPVHVRPFQDGFPEAGPSKRPTSPKTLLLEAAQQTFSSSDAIHYEYLTGGQPTSVQCIITIRRPDGISRSFKSKPYAQKSEADADAAATAIELGALQFIRTGHAPPNHGNLAPLDAPPQQNAVNIPQDAITLIANCCKDWRAGLVSPDWTKLITADQHLVTTYGAALRIQLSDHVLNVYSTDTVFESYSEAQTVCAKDAVDQGVLDFIKFGNGQVKSSKGSDPVDTIMLQPSKPKQSTTTLQTFLESLPKPFPEYPDSKTVAEINPLAWLNNVTQTCRGGRVSTKFIFNSNYTIGRNSLILGGSNIP
ncbi:hypothetical protein ONZ45_g12336 [Pleurotus djamor]|nr:hypothetical protein ONZ45_g12336 [Pleurotus djamor]